LLAESSDIFVFLCAMLQQADADTSPEVLFPAAFADHAALYKATTPHTIPLRLFQLIPDQA